MKKIVSVILVVVMSLCLATSAFAAEPVNTASPALEDYVAEMIPQIYDLSLTEISSLSIGTEINTYRVTATGVVPAEYEVYPIIGNGNIIAFANVTENDAGELCVTCSVSLAPELQEYYEGNPGRNIAVLYAEEGVYVLDSLNMLHLLQNRVTYDTGSIDTVQPAAAAIVRGGIAPAQSVEVSSQIQTRALQTLHYQILNIVGVANTSTTCCSDGLCWAVSIAMIANYLLGESYDALDIHSECGHLGTSDDQPFCYGDAIVELGLYHNGLTSVDLTYLYMKTEIQNDNPLFIQLDKNGGGTGHVVVGYGYYWNEGVSTTKYFYIIDPNDVEVNGETGEVEEYSGQIVAFPSSGDITFSLGSNSYTVGYYYAVSGDFE